MSDARQTKEPQASAPYGDDVAIFLDMTDEEAKSMILLLMIEAEVKKRLAKYRPKDLGS